MFGHSKKRKSPWLEIDFTSFSEWLPYRYVWEEENLFMNTGSVGFGFEVSVCAGVDERFIQSLEDIVKYQLPDNYDMQCIFWGSQIVGPSLNHSVKSEQMKSYYERASKSHFKAKNHTHLSVRDYRLYLFVSVGTEYSEKVIESVKNVKSALGTEFTTIGLDARLLNTEGFLELTRAMINPNPTSINPKSVKYEKESLLNESVVDRTFECEVNVENIDVCINDDISDNEKIHSTITNLSVRQWPDQFALWMGADNYTNIFEATHSIRCPFFINFTLRLIPESVAKARAQQKYLDLERKARSVYAKYIAGTTDLAAEWKRLRDQLNNDETRLVQCSLNVMLQSKSDKHVHDDVSSVIDCYRKNGITLSVTKYLQLQSMYSALPFMMSEGMFDDLKKAHRIKTLTTWNAVNFMPLVGDYKLGLTGVPLLTRRQQLGFFDLFSDKMPVTNFNVAISATSGSGKSFLAQTLIKDVLDNNGTVFVIDMGHSYKKFCEIMGGKYLEYGALSLNPFKKVVDINESVEQLRDLLSILASPEGNLSEVQEQVLEKCILAAWKKNKNNTNIDQVVDELTKYQITHPDQRVLDVITLLERYKTNGPYGKIFNSSSDIAGDSNLVVLELGELENKPDLMKAVLFALILRIEQSIYQTPRHIRKMVVIDEAWRLLSGENRAAARFIEKGYRTSRRHLASFVTITQDIRDYHQSVEANACWNNSDIKIIMRQNAKAFEDFLEEHNTVFPSYEVRLIKGFVAAKNTGYSEFMLQLGKLSTFQRLFVDPFSRVLFSSEAKEFEAVKGYCDTGLSLNDSVYKVAMQNYPEEFYDE